MVYPLAFFCFSAFLFAMAAFIFFLRDSSVPKMRAHSSSRTGTTDRRDWRTSWNWGRNCIGQCASTPWGSA